MATWDEKRLRVENEVMGAMVDFLRAEGISYKSDIGYLEFPRPMVPEDEFKKIVEKAESKLKELGYENYNVFETAINVSFPEQIEWYEATFSLRKEGTQMWKQAGSKEKREWYVYVLPFEEIPFGTALSGYMTEAEARGEAERVQREIPKWRGLVLALPRSDERIREYARTHPAWAKREGFTIVSPISSPGQEVREGDIGTLVESIMAEDTAGRSRRIPAGMEVRVSAVYPRWISFVTGEVIEGENIFVALPLEFRGAFRKRGASPTSWGERAPPSHDCPVCGDTVVGGPDEYLGHIKARHPEEWRRLEADPSYTLRPQVGVVVPISEEERVREVAMRILDLLREKGPMRDYEISKQLGVPTELVSKATDKLMTEGKIEWELLTGLYKIPEVRAEAGIFRCRFCGAPYLYRENLEAHERSCLGR